MNKRFNIYISILQFYWLYYVSDYIKEIIYIRLYVRPDFDIRINLIGILLKNKMLLTFWISLTRFSLKCFRDSARFYLSVVWDIKKILLGLVETTVVLWDCNFCSLEKYDIFLRYTLRTSRKALFSAKQIFN